MAALFPWGKQPEFPVHCIGTKKLSNLIYPNVHTALTTINYELDVNKKDEVRLSKLVRTSLNHVPPDMAYRTTSKKSGYPMKMSFVLNVLTFATCSANS